MTTLDVFFAVCVVSAVVGLLMLSLSYVDVTGIAAVSNATAGIPTYTPSSMSSSLTQTALLFPTIAVIMVVVLIIESWILSAFIKASPLSAVVAIAFLVVYTIASFFIANTMVQVMDSVPIFHTATNANLLMLFYANMPGILVWSAIIDCAIAMLALNS